MDKQLDFLAIGDVTSDVFIKLKDAEVHCDIDQKNCRISMRFGDKIPYESATEVHAVGNSPNASVSASRLGLTSAIMTNIGNDEIGRLALETFKQEKVTTDFVTTEDGKKTNYHYVLWFGSERTILIKHTEFNYKLPTLNPPKWIYLSSLGENSLAFHEEIASYVASNPEVKLAFQPGTFQINLGIEKLKSIYQVTTVLVCNVEEAKKILGQENETDITKLIKNLHNHGPKIVIITDGPNGAYASDGEAIWQMPIYPDPKPPVDRTGAGDAFASTVVSALALGKSLPEALTWGPINSMSVVQEIGAQKGLLNKEQIENHLAKAPTDYQAKKIN